KLNVVGDLNVSGTSSELFVYGTGNSFITGNLGIGTTNPQQKLNVVGDLNVSGTSSELFVYGTGNSFITGNLGIGTTNPQQKLNVVGDANVTGAMIISSMNITVEGNGDVNIW
ncbi:hypothetical protein L6261_03215, partial [Candidatus Parcubacteria bacterium]|nr:hypothetical protein [Candidatus Parcubacteria bacterium]